jgi:hypothetical protein
MLFRDADEFILKMEPAEAAASPQGEQKKQSQKQAPQPASIVFKRDRN